MIEPNWKWTHDIEDEIIKEIAGLNGLVVHVCSGTSGLGEVRIDRYFSDKYAARRRLFGLPNIIADYRYLPLKSKCAAAVICDPPYSLKRRAKEYPGMVNELVRATALGGKILFVAPWVLYHKTLEVTRLLLRPISTFPSYKVLSISRKINDQLSVDGGSVLGEN